MQEGERFEKLCLLSFRLQLRHKIWAQASHEKEMLFATVLASYNVYLSHGDTFFTRIVWFV